MRIYIRRHRGAELRNGHVQYARRPFYLDSTFRRPVSRRSWRNRLIDALAVLTLVISGVLSLVILLAFGAGLFYLALAVGRVLHRYLGIGGAFS